MGDKDKSNSYVFKPDTPPKQFSDFDFGTFDIETKRDGDTGGANANNFLYGVVQPDPDNQYVFWDKDEMFWFMCQRKFKNKVWFAHNGEYDLSGLMDNIYMDTDNHLFNGGQLIQASKCVYVSDQQYYNKKSDKWYYHKEYVYFRDSMNYFKTGLDNIGQAIGYKKIQMGLNEEQIKKQIEKCSPNSIRYCKRDCKVLYKALSYFVDFLHSFNINPKMTIASNSMKIFKTNYLKGTYFVDYKDQFFLQSYYGGRTETFKTKIDNGKCYDVNSLYPYAMMRGRFPNPSKLRKTQNKKIINQVIDNEKFEGTVKVQVRYTGNYPILPYKKGNKLYFPKTDKHKDLVGWYNLNELRFALSRGYKLIDVFDCVYSEGITSPFADFVNDIYQWRLYFKQQDSVFELFCKYILNSLYGKFCEYREIAEVMHISDVPRGWSYEFMGDTEFVYAKKLNQNGDVEYELTNHTIFAWGSYVTSYARIILYEHFESVGFDVAYCDTDSIFTMSEIESTKELGGMKLEYQFQDGVFIKPKHYKLTEIVGYGDNFILYNRVSKLKGVSSPQDIMKRQQMIIRVVKNREALRRNLNPGDSIIQPKNISFIDNKRVWFNNGTSRPASVNEIDNDLVETINQQNVGESII